MSQVFFSESVQILEEKEKWVKIKNEIDGYQGWIEREVLCERKDPYLQSLGKRMAKVARLRAHLYDIDDTVFGSLLTLPFESQLRVLDPVSLTSTNRWIKVSTVAENAPYIRISQLSAAEWSSGNYPCRLGRTLR